MSVGKERVYDQELIYARVIGLLASSRDINFDDVLACELAAYPPSMFNPDGEMAISKPKSTLKQKLQVTVSERNCPVQNTMIYQHYSGSSTGHLTNFMCMLMPLRSLSFKLYKGQM